jgi:hypothetical protein
LRHPPARTAAHPARSLRDGDQYVGSEFNGTAAVVGYAAPGMIGVAVEMAGSPMRALEPKPW